MNPLLWERSGPIWNKSYDGLREFKSISNILGVNGQETVKNLITAIYIDSQEIIKALQKLQNTIRNYELMIPINYALYEMNLFSTVIILACNHIFNDISEFNRIKKNMYNRMKYCYNILGTCKSNLQPLLIHIGTFSLTLLVMVIQIFGPNSFLDHLTSIRNYIIEFVGELDSDNQTKMHFLLINSITKYETILNNIVVKDAIALNKIKEYMRVLGNYLFLRMAQRNIWRVLNPLPEYDSHFLSGTIIVDLPRLTNHKESQSKDKYGGDTLVSTGKEGN